MTLFNRIALLLPLAGASSAAMADAAQSHAEGFLDGSTWSMLNRFTAGPNDKLTHRVAVLAQTPGEQRTRFFADGVYVPKDIKEHTALLEAAFLAVKAADATERKVRKAVRAKQIAKQKGAKLYEEALAKNVITKAEFDSLAHAEELRWKAIQVDEFTLEQYKNRA